MAILVKLDGLLHDRRMTLTELADDLSGRLVGIFLDADGRRPVFGDEPLFDDPRWHDLVPFHEYFHGDTGKGLGASHQTGWTGLIADVIRRRHGVVGGTGGVLADVDRDVRR